MNRIAFFKMGEFSYINEMVLNALRDQYPDYQIDVIDIFRDLLNKNDYRLVASCLLEYGGEIITRKKGFFSSLTRTTYFFNKVKVEANKYLRGKNYKFTFQTQSLFDVSLDGVPNFMYTDHTHLANLYYPAFDRSKLFSKKWIELEKTIYNNATINFTMSSHVSRSLKEHYDCNSEKVVNAYCGCNSNTFTIANMPSDERYLNSTILFVGVVWDRKGGPELWEAFKRVLEKHPKARLVIVGCAPEIDHPNVDVVGRVPLEEVLGYYARATVFCVPTRVEPFGIVFIEASTNQLPVVSTNIGALPDIVLPGKTGYLVEPGDIRSLADSLTLLLDFPEKCREYGVQGRAWVKDKYTWENAGNRLRENIDRACGV